MHPYYAMRAVGGLLFTLGAAVMLYNMIMTIRMAGARQSSVAHA
jgi:cytochrome c oxidase cbb3-type subunit 1